VNPSDFDCLRVALEGHLLALLERQVVHALAGDHAELREVQRVRAADRRARGDDPAQESTYHNNFQDADRFLAAGGRRGRQLQVLVDGTYCVNRIFATIEMVPKTVIEVETRTLIQLIQDRSAIQQVAGEQMKEKFARYNLELQEVLIGTPRPEPAVSRSSRS
jgi:hypothetical protein